MSNLPKGWEKTKIGEVCKFSQGVQIPIEEQLTEKQENYIRFLRISDYTQNTTDIRYVPNSYNNSIISEEEIVMVRYGETAGHIGRGFYGVLANNLFTINPTTEKLSKDFLYIFMKQPSMYNYLKKLRASGAMPAVNFKSLSIIELPIPPLEEQKKIADILNTVDKKIAFVEENINATEELKKGLMQKLLTEGIGHTEFKDSELGRIPESWEVVKLPEITVKITSGGTPSRAKPEYYENGTVNWIKTGELRDCYIYDSEEKITEEAVINSSAKKFPVDTLLIAMYGATIGRTAYLKVESSTNQACCAIIFNPEKANTHFYWQYFLFIREILISKGCGAGQPNISQGIIKDLSIPCPPLEEQKQIAEILSTVDTKLENLKEKKQYFEELKKGLMQKLLTGEVRV
ncbi:restriction endonuclease subunit S [Aliarcobacter cryaerophilus]|uniref:restriction endonuclease subunit S n=1 Tax=Aliarcobacter cryaerophilus TaxID=28198 RepID=UPI00082B3FAD|nr:restriction endonuclease subunit S [Aliarcobacter cryaerophilus]